MKAVFVFACFLFAGCASTIELKSIDDARERIGEGSAMVHLKSGHEYFGQDVQIENDSVRLPGKTTDDTLFFSIRNVKYIRVTNHTLGAIEGFFIGGVILATSVFLMGSSNHADEGYVNRKVRDAFTLIGGGAGGVLGSAIGGGIGHHYTYIFPEDSIKADAKISIDSINRVQEEVPSGTR